LAAGVPELLAPLTRDARFIAANLPLLGEGFVQTISVAAASLVVALGCTILLVVLRLSASRAVSATTLAYIELVRNTPLLIQVFLIYFGLPLVGLVLSPFLCGVTGIAGQHGAFLAEVLRAAILSIDPGQREAARALGLRERHVFWLVILPQALRRVLPSVGGQVLILIKDSAVVAGIGIIELTLAGKIIIERSAASYQVFVVIAVAFLALNLAVGSGFRLAERRWVAGRHA
jgi:polar amino acid transport system permease protein